MAPKKKVLLFGHGYGPQFIDISNQYTKIFNPLLYDVTLVYLVGAGSAHIEKKHLAKNIIFLNLSNAETRGLKISAIRKMLHLHRQHHFDIVICQRYKPTYIMLWVNRFYRIPVFIAIMHELQTFSALGRRLILRVLSPQHLYLAGVSNAVREDLRSSIISGFPHDRIITLYNVLDIALTKPHLLSREEARTKLNLPEEAFIFGTIGRLVPAKNQVTLINAFAKIKSDCPNALLIIIGEGELFATLKTQVQTLNLDKAVVFAGYIEEAFRYLPAFDVFVLPSIKEAFGRVLLEAMVAKVPLIAAKTNGIPEVVGDSGTLVTAVNTDQLANAMKQFVHLDKTTLSALGDTAYARVHTHFSLDKFTHDFWQLPLLNKTLI